MTSLFAVVERQGKGVAIGPVQEPSVESLYDNIRSGFHGYFVIVGGWPVGAARFEFRTFASLMGCMRHTHRSTLSWCFM